MKLFRKLTISVSKQRMENRKNLIFCLFLSIVTIGIFWQIQDHEFIIFDDPGYIYENKHVIRGLTFEAVKWAFLESHAANWHPITWISHILDFEMYGLDPGGHHRTNLIFHTVNAILLFLVFLRMTGGFWQSAVIATLFAIHPLHVESVAWASERKDVLSMFFLMFTIWAYLRYIENKEIKNYLLVFLFFALGLMSKPMLVTLPFVLLLLDFWPLKRTGGNLKQLIIEKIPLFGLALGSSVITFFVQQGFGATALQKTIQLDQRIFNAIVSYAEYLWKLIWPLNLSIFYPHQGYMLPTWKIFFSAILLIGITVLAVKTIKRTPFVAVGWFWYLGTLVPVIGIVQVGSQSMANRYTYIPLIGIFIILAGGIPYLLKTFRHQKQILIILSLVVGSFYTFVTWSQVKYWKNSILLFERAIEVVEDENINFAIAHKSLGRSYFKNNEFDKAITSYEKCLVLNPDHWRCYQNIGNVFVEKKEFQKALNYFQLSVKINSNNDSGYNNIGVILQRSGKLDESIELFKKAIKLNPDYVLFYFNLGNTLVENNMIGEAILQYKEALNLDPQSYMIHFKLGNALAKNGFYAESINHFESAINLKPDYIPAIENIKIVNSRMDNQYSERNK